MEEAPVIRTTALFVSRNAVDQLRRSLASIEDSQDRAAIDIVVVDNGSTDGSAQLDVEFPAASFLRLPRNFGHAKALNIGIRTGKGDYVLIAEPGAEFAADAIARMVARLDSEPDAVAVCPRIAAAFPLPTPEQLFAEWKGPAPLTAVDVDDRGTAQYVRGVPMLVRRTFLTGMRYFDERFGDAGWDLDLCRQIRNAGKKIVVLPEVDVPFGAAEPDGSAVANADRLNAVAVYARKYYGFGAALNIRFAAALTALARFDFALLTGVLSGRKTNGEQPGA